MISAVMIISLAASFVIGSGGATAVSPDQTAPQAVDGNDLLVDPPATDAQETPGDTSESEDSGGGEEGTTDSD